MKRPDLFVFDLDGTLIDSRTDLANAANAALERLGLPALSTETIISYVGNGLDALIRRCLTPEHEDLFPVAKSYFTEYYRAHFLDNTSLLPGVSETLEALKRTSLLAVLTNKSQAYAVEILKGLGVTPYFSEIVGEQNGRVPKPDPAVLLEIMKRLKVSGEHTLMVGDGKNDILVAKAAGCLSCLIVNAPDEERVLSAYGPDFIIHRMDELTTLFEGE